MKHLLQVFNAQFAYLDRFQGYRCPSIDTNDFDVLAHPIQRKVNPPGISTGFDFLFDHLLPEDPKLGSGGFAGILRFAAALLQACFCFPGDLIVICLVEHTDFLSEPNPSVFRADYRPHFLLTLIDPATSWIRLRF